MNRNDFARHVELAINDYIQGLTGEQAAKKHGISVASLRRHMKARGISISPEERHRRRVAAGKKTQEKHPGNVSHPCPPGCTCNRHKSPKNQKHKIVQGRKHCGKCLRWRYLVDFDARKRNIEGDALAWQTVCKPCMRERCRVHAGLKRRGKPYEPLSNRKKMTREEVLERRRQRHQELRQDEEWLERRREYDRIYAEAKRREKGLPRREKALMNRERASKGPRLPVGPMSDWINAKLSNGYAGDVSRLAKNCGIDESQLRRIRDRKYDQILEGVVDSMLTSEGSTDLWMVYPSLYE